MRIVIIGSGIAGAGTAWHLARRGAEVVVVDADLAGRATAAGAGIVSPWSSRSLDGQELAFHAEGAAYYRRFVPELIADLAENADNTDSADQAGADNAGIAGTAGTAGRTDNADRADNADSTENTDNVIDPSFAVVGGLVVSPDEVWLREFHACALERAGRWPEAGEVTLLDPAQARERMPLLAPELGAVHIAGGGRVDGRRLREAFLAGAAAHGARIREGAAELDVRGDRVVGVRVGSSRIDADGVVLAAGAWSGALVEPLGARLPVEPQRGQISHFGVAALATTAAMGDTSSWPVVSPVGSGHYMLAFPDARVVAGATRETGSGFDHRVTADGQREVLAEALAVAPGLAEATLLETRVGFRPVSADGRPVIGPLAGYPEVTVLTGFGAGGLTIGPYASSLAADVALGRNPGIPDMFRADRFDGVSGR